MQADLLMDLRAAVDKAMAEGTTYETFRKDFKKIVAERGWTGWTGEGTKAGQAWRARVIYDTNLFTTYSAGRYRQMKDIAHVRPWWRYRHSPASVHPRKEHQAWDGMILRHDDPWWSTHTPPNGWGCKCYIETLADRDMKRLGLEPTNPDRIPVNALDPKTGLPQGIDKGWDYQPGASLLERNLLSFSEKMEKQPREIAVAGVASLVNSEVFRRWLKKPEGEFPLAVLNETDAAAIGAKTRVAHLSAETVVKQKTHHPELTADEYVQAQACVAQGERIQDGSLSLIYLLESAGYVTVVKATKTGESVFVTSFRRLSKDAAKQDSEIRRLRRKGV
ncbi:MAG: phage minor head protein [Candidatus Competibacteraceae bacterium]